MLLKAFEILVRQNAHLSLKLLIVGKGSLEAELKQLANNLGVQKQVKFSGYIPPHEVPDYHTMIDVFVCLSHYGYLEV